MMQNVHLAPEEENDDLYSGYDYNDPMLEVGRARIGSAVGLSSGESIDFQLMRTYNIYFSLSPRS